MVSVFVYVDALPYEQINDRNTPFLNKLLKGGRTYSLQNIMGYSFGIQSTLLSGKLPSETKHWMPYVYTPNGGSLAFSVFSSLARRVNAYIELPYFLKVARYGFMSRIILRRGAKICCIPLKFLDRFRVYPYYFMNELPFFSELKRKLHSKYGTKLLYFGPPISKEPVKQTIKYIENLTRNRGTENALILVYVDILDGVGHKHGVDSSVWRATLNRIDDEVKTLYNFIETNLKRWNFAMFSDHGMCNVKHTIDIIGYMKSHGLNWKHITFFVDATLTLIWVNEKKAEHKVLELIDSIGRDKVVIMKRERDEEVLRKYGIYRSDRAFGDIIVQTKLGYMFFPNFYSDLKPFRGVHGFLPGQKPQQSFITLVLNRDSAINDLPIHHIRHLKNVLEFMSSLESSKVHNSQI